jgi:hypothetical protein
LQIAREPDAQMKRVRRLSPDAPLSEALEAQDYFFFAAFFAGFLAAGFFAAFFAAGFFAAFAIRNPPSWVGLKVLLRNARIPVAERPASLLDRNLAATNRRRLLGALQ